mgnify:CR=1 FL=1
MWGNGREGAGMTGRVSIGHQDFETIRTKGYFYIDKTRFIREWWESGDSVTLLTRPRRFGKTLNLSMLEKFFSVEYAGRGDLFEGLSIWEDEKYRELQGTYPVIFLSFASVKETNYDSARKRICQLIAEEYGKYVFLLEKGGLTETEKESFLRKTMDMSDIDATYALHQLSLYLSRYYGKKVIILLDEYDTPMQEAYVNGFWEEIVAYIRSMFNATFKTNPYLECAIMTGITRVSKESIFSDLNNLKVVTATSDKYADSFGFTEEEVFGALEAQGMSEWKQQVKEWYDGFTFGNKTDIYNPWSIINFLDEKRIGTYWANSSSNSLVGKLIREGSREIKVTMEKLLKGETFRTSFDEQIVFSQLGQTEESVWSLLLASGYLKAVSYHYNIEDRKAEYELRLTNLEVQAMFERMIDGWFGTCRGASNGFLRAMLEDDIKIMNVYMNKVTREIFSYFDTGGSQSGEESERFYHGFVLGLMVELTDRYVITSNRESGYGRYDVMLEPKTSENNAIIIEFKVQEEDEKELSATVERALHQIEDRNYEAGLIAREIPKERVRKYGFAFCGKEVLIGRG